MATSKVDLKKTTGTATVLLSKVAEIISSEGVPDHIRERVMERLTPAPPGLEEGVTLSEKMVAKVGQGVTDFEKAEVRRLSAPYRR